VHIIAKKKRKEEKVPKPLESVDDLILEHWLSEVDIDENNNGHITQATKGRVKYGRLREKLISIFSDKPTSLENMSLVIKDLNTGDEIIPEVIIDDPKYKWVKVPFRYPIEKDEEFGFEARYIQPNTYKAVGEDYYSYTSRHDFNDIIIKIKFPKNVRIVNTEGSNVRTSGGIILDLPKGNRPIIAEDEGKPCITWVIKHGKIGYTYTVRWKTEKIS
jgi:hypothetical protein